MKIRDTITINSSGVILNGVFTSIAQKTNKPLIVTNDNQSILNRYYYLGRSGNKNASLLLENYKEIDEEHYISVLADIIVEHYKDKWDRLYNAFIEGDYNPLENYSMVEVETPNLTRQIETKVKQDITTNSENDAETYAFNSSDSTPTDKTHSSVNVVADEDDNKTTSTENETGNKTLTRSGNIGVTTSQQMLESELKLREYSLYEEIYKDVDKILTSSYYE